MAKRLHVAAVQIHAGGTVRETVARAERQIRAAAGVGVDVILFSEVCLHGYDYDRHSAWTRRRAEPVDGPNCRRVTELARKHRIHVLMGFLERDGNQVFNSHLVTGPDGVIGVERKHNLTAGEGKAGLTPGAKTRTVFTFNGVRTAIVICADAGMRGLFPMLNRAGVQFRFCPTGGGGRLEDYLHERDLRTATGRRKYVANRPRVFNADALIKAQPSQRPFIGFASANALGPAGRRTCHQGHCMIVDNQRVLRAQIPGTNVLEHQQDQMIHVEMRF